MMRQLSWTALSSIIAAVTQIILLFLLAGLGGTEQLGLYSLSFLFITFGTIVAESGLSQFYIQQNIRSPVRRFTLFGLSLCYVGIPIFVLNSIALFISNIELARLLQLGSLILLISNLMLLHQAELLRQQAFKQLALIESGWRLLQLIAGVPMLFFYNASAFTLLCLLAAGYAVKAVLLYGFVNFPLRSLIHKATFFAAVKYGMPLTLSNFISVFRAQIDQVVVVYALGVGQLGVYSLAKELIGYTHKLLNSVVTRIGFPVLCNTDNRAKAQIGVKMVAAIAWSNLGCQLFFIVSLGLLGYVLQLSAYQASLSVLMLLSCYAIIRPAGLVNSLLAQSLARNDVELKWNLLSITSIVPVALVALITEDLKMISIAMSVVQLTATLISFTFFNAHLKLATAQPFYKVIVWPLFISAGLMFAGLTL